MIKIKRELISTSKEGNITTYQYKELSPDFGKDPPFDWCFLIKLLFLFLL